MRRAQEAERVAAMLVGSRRVARLREWRRRGAGDGGTPACATSAILCEKNMARNGHACKHGATTHRETFSGAKCEMMAVS